MRCERASERALLVSVVLFGMLLVGCGGGGGDSGASPPPPIVPTQFSYQIRALASGPLTVTMGEVSAEIADLNMDGTYDRSSEAATMTRGSSPLAVTLQGPPFGTLPVSIMEDWAWVGNGSPTAGELIVQRSVSDTIWLTVDNTVPGVQVSWDNGGVVSGPDAFTWAEFEAIPGSAAPEYQQIAAYAYEARGFVFEQAGLAVDTLEVVTSMEDNLVRGPVVLGCDRYPPGTGTAGTITYTWVDVSGNGEPGPGDTFAVSYDQCWVDDPDDDIDTILSGSATLSGYTEVAGPPLLLGGDMTFSDLVVTETQEVSPGTYVTQDAVTINGGFSVLFVEQEGSGRACSCLCPPGGRISRPPGLPGGGSLTGRVADLKFRR